MSDSDSPSSLYICSTTMHAIAGFISPLHDPQLSERFRAVCSPAAACLSASGTPVAKHTTGRHTTGWRNAEAQPQQLKRKPKLPTQQLTHFEHPALIKTTHCKHETPSSRTHCEPPSHLPGAVCPQGPPQLAASRTCPCARHAPGAQTGSRSRCLRSGAHDTKGGGGAGGGGEWRWLEEATTAGASTGDADGMIGSS
jgi:hypothetical protein